MYIIFDSEGEETLRYFLEDLPKELKQYKYRKVDEKDIPEKDGYIERAKLVDGELEWEFIEVKEPINPEEEILKLKKELKDKNDTVSKLKNELSVLSDTVDFLIKKGDEVND